jgi:hypothetical protein
MPLPGTESGKQISLTIRNAHIPKPAYAARSQKEGVANAVPQLQVFEGVRRTLLNSQGVHSAYVAYSKSRPVFTVYHNSGGFRIKPLLNGVHLKLKGEKPIPGKAGEFWDVTREQMTRATIVRGWYWWRFSLIETPAFLAEEDEGDAIVLAENRVFRNAFVGISAMLTAAVIFTLFQTPPPEEKKEEPIPPETVKLYIKKVPMNKQEGKVEVAVAKPTQDIDHSSKAEARKAGDNKENAKLGHQQAHKESNKPKAAVEAKAPSPPTAHPVVNNSKAPPGPKVAKPEKTGAEKVAESANALRKALGGASALTEKDVVKDVSGGQPNVGDLFANKGAAFSPTEVKAGKVSGSASVHGVGGGAAGGGGAGGGGDVAAGEGGGNVGYGEGDKGLVAGKGGGFVSLDNGGSEVEEGLTKEEVGRVIHEHMSEVRYCHEAALLANPKVEGKLMLKFVINAGGIVESAGIQSSNLTDHSLESCIIRRLVTWKFPHPKGGVKVNVAYPFLFKLLGGV